MQKTKTKHNKGKFKMQRERNATKFNKQKTFHCANLVHLLIVNNVLPQQIALSYSFN